jgi:uncharacterized protein
MPGDDDLGVDMLISLHDINKNGTTRIVEFAVSASQLVFNNEEIRTLEPIKVSGTVDVAEGVAAVKLTAATRLAETCSRCLEEFERDLVVEIDEAIAEGGEDEEGIVPVQEGGFIDLRDVVLNSIYISMPIKVLCKEDCKGLCQSCGTNLNIQECDCASVDEDPRLSALKDIFKEV